MNAVIKSLLSFMLGLAAMSSAGLAQTLEGSVLEGPMLGGPALEVGAANAAGMSELRLGLRGVRVPAGSLGTGTLCLLYTSPSPRD